MYVIRKTDNVKQLGIGTKKIIMELPLKPAFPSCWLCVPHEDITKENVVSSKRTVKFFSQIMLS